VRTRRGKSTHTVLRWQRGPASSLGATGGPSSHAVETPGTAEASYRSAPLDAVRLVRGVRSRVLDYLAQAIRFIMQQPLVMAPWIMFTSMLYLLQKRAHRFRRRGTFRLFTTSIIMAVTIPLTTTMLAWVFDHLVQEPTSTFLFLAMGPLLIILAFALTVTLMQRFMGADAETALAMSWPIVVITYVVPLIICFILSVFHIPWLTGQQQFP